MLQINFCLLFVIKFSVKLNNFRAQTKRKKINHWTRFKNLKSISWVQKA